jgi:hypothetical protein
MRARSQQMRIKPRNIRYRVYWIGAIIMVLCLSAIRPRTSLAADYAEITVELNSTWRSRTLTNHHNIAATCIVGSNRWFISGDFLKNVKVDYWYIAPNVVEFRTITSEKIPGEKPRSRIVHSYPRAGEKFTTVHPSPMGQPAFRGGDGVVWLAFCSGNYLKRLGRQIPMPIGPSSHAFGYADQTVQFDDPFGLPKSVKLFATNGALTCEYEVLAMTNFLGRTFPLQFRVMQFGQPANGDVRGSSMTELEGRVISITAGKWREVPDEVWNKVGP